MLKNAHLLRSLRPSSLQRTYKNASLLRNSGAPAGGISQGSTCICLPKPRRRQGHFWASWEKLLFQQPV